MGELHAAMQEFAGSAPVTQRLKANVALQAN